MKTSNKVLKLLQEKGPHIKVAEARHEQGMKPWFFGLTAHVTYRTEVKQIETDNEVVAVELCSDGNEDIISIEVLYGLSTGYIDYYTKEDITYFYYEDRDDAVEMWNDCIDEDITEEQWTSLLNMLQELTDGKD